MKTLLVAPALHSLHGGIPRLLRLYQRALVELGGPGDSVEVVVLNDGAHARAPVSGSPARERRDDVGEPSRPSPGGLPGKPPTPSVGAGRSKLRFAWHLFRLGWRAERIVCGHIHLAPLVRLLQLVRPRLRLFIVGHGIEVWRRLSRAQLGAAHTAERILCVSEFTRRELLRYNPGLPADRVVVVPNAIEPAWGGQISDLRFQISDARIGGTIALEPERPRSGEALGMDSRGGAAGLSQISNLKSQIPVPSDGTGPSTIHNSPSTSVMPARSAVLLTVSRLTTVDREKGVEDVIAALPLVRAEFPNATLRIVGTGDDEARLQRIAATISDDVRAKVGQTAVPAEVPGRRLGPSMHGPPTSGQTEGSLRHPDPIASPEAFTRSQISNFKSQIPVPPGGTAAVTFLGSLDDVALRAEYAACDVFVLPSRKEGFGLVYLEAMAFGKPCVAAEAGGAPEVVTPEVGQLVPYGDVAAIAAAIIALLRQPVDPARVRAHAAKFSYEAFRARLQSALRVV